VGHGEQADGWRAQERIGPQEQRAENGVETRLVSQRVRFTNLEEERRDQAGTEEVRREAHIELATRTVAQVARAQADHVAQRLAQIVVA
jgi:hypothetical protein